MTDTSENLSHQAGEPAHDPESPCTQAQVAALAEQVANLREEMTALRRQQDFLAAQVYRLQTQAAEYEAKTGAEPAKTDVGRPANLPARPGNDPARGCAHDIVRVLQEVGHPLTTLGILEELVRRKLVWGDSTLRHVLAGLVDEGIVKERRDIGPHSYGLK